MPNDRIKQLQVNTNVYDLYDKTAVHKSGDETIDDIKTFSSRPVLVVEPKVPVGYQEIEYVKFSGTDYIDSNILATESTDIKLCFSLDAVGGGAFGLWGSYTDNDYLVKNTAATTLTWWYKGTSIVYNGNWVIDNKYVVEKVGNLLLLDGTTIMTQTAKTFTTSYTSYIGNRHDSAGSVTNGLKGNIYYFDITHNGILRPFVACYRLSDNAVGFYDTTNESFFPLKKYGSSAIIVYVNGSTGGKPIKDSEFLTLADIEDIDVDLTLQDVTDNGNTTTNNMIVGGDVRLAGMTSSSTTSNQFQFTDANGTKYAYFTGNTNNQFVIGAGTNSYYSFAPTELRPITGSGTGYEDGVRPISLGTQVAPWKYIYGKSVYGTGFYQYDTTSQTYIALQDLYAPKDKYNTYGLNPNAPAHDYVDPTDPGLGDGTHTYKFWINKSGQVMQLEQVPISFPPVNNSTISFSVNGTTITDNFTLNQASGETINLGTNFVLTSGNQTVGGTKDFTSRPTLTTGGNTSEFLVRSDISNVVTASSSLTQDKIVVGSTNSSITTSNYSVQDIIDIAHGASDSYVIATEACITGTKDSSTGNYTNVSAIRTEPSPGGEEIDLTAVNIGDTIYIKQTGVSDYWVSGKSGSGSSTRLTLNKIETVKIGTLVTTATTAQSTSSGESFSGTINLHKIAKTGTYNDLIGKPTIPTVSDATITIKQTGISDQTFTLNGSATTITLADTNTNTTYSLSGSNATVTLTGSDSSTTSHTVDYVTHAQQAERAEWAESADTATDAINAVYAENADNAEVADYANNAGTLENHNGAYYLNYSNFTNTPTIPTATSDLTNDSGFITSEDIPTDYVSTSNVNQTIDGIKSFTNRPRLLGERLPSEYQEVQSITLSTSDYIDTGIVITQTNGLVMELDGAWNGANSNFATFFGYMHSSTSPRCAVSIYTNRYMIGINATVSGTTVPFTGRALYRFYVSNGMQVLTINGATEASTTVTSNTLASNTLSMYLGARNSGGTANNFSGITIYSFYVSANGSGYNFIPCYRKSDNKIGIYDILNTNFIPVTGSGATKGANVTDSEFLVYNDLATVATTGSYSDLSNKPTLGTAAACNTGTSQGNVPVLNSSGKLPDEVLPDLSITDTYVVSSKSEMLALNARKGDICIISSGADVGTYVLKQEPASTEANWAKMPVPATGVTSITAGTGLTGGTITGTGTIAANFGNAAGTICQGNDSRLSDARTPTSHASSASTYGLGTTSLYGHVMLVAGDLKNVTTTTDGKAAASNHTHSQYLTAQTWREVQLGGTTKIASTANTALNFKNTGNVTFSYDSGISASIPTQTAYTEKGTATKVAQITTNTLGQVTSVTEVNIELPQVLRLI